ncbi:MAG: GHKL domain-containing protein [Defluviitaleaceae bacterium]|nr:GHKL domain-containing protein [Defluviitaleaceae bacterium]
MNGIISLLMIHYGMRQIFELGVKKIWVLLGYAALFTIVSQTFFEFGNPLITITINVIGFFAISFFYFGRVSGKIIFIITMYAMMIVAEGMAFLGLSYVYFLEHGVPMPLDEVMTIVRTAVNIIFAPLLFINIMLFRRILTKKERSKNSKLPLSLTIIFFGMLVGIIFSNILIASAVVFDTPERALPIIISYFISSLTLFFLVGIYNEILRYLEALEKARLKEQMMERWEVQYQTAVNSQKAIKIFKHDLSLHFLTILSFLKKDKLSDAKLYLEDAIGSLDCIVTTENLSIDTMLNYYEQKAKEVLGISFTMNIFIPPNLNLDPKLTGMILGNALENAIEACVHVEMEKRYIRIVAKITLQNELYIEIINPYNIFPVTDKAGNLKTTKLDKDNHGLGLISIQEGLTEDIGHMLVEYTDNTFRFIVLLYDVRKDDKSNMNDAVAVVMNV